MVKLCSGLFKQLKDWLAPANNLKLAKIHPPDINISDWIFQHGRRASFVEISVYHNK